ncbi:Type II restriction modification system N6-adenine DNA methyltransferase [Metamycoplasma alkalescens 14918]|uniref:Site-specific DNA-methyltransferase (adenine-specific) n=1 Tax=Metamycoplasma alkalescens 14918 TaxID=1188234 RepID=N9SR13_9BACT|nr:DNA adenine methylase [Metamycoplasma alkalescens]ENY53920.1 Type II restriction modification system N6-adenine DNA methyltransferase [Metamycoplasma alkalescens 14918]
MALERIEKTINSLSVQIHELINLKNILSSKPFVKWAGGKTQLLKKIKELVPENFDNYFEPFVGGGALFFSLTPKKAIINDTNEELISAYKCFLDDYKYNKLVDKLKEHESKHSKEYYYQIRNLDRFPDFDKMKDFERAARLIYLNKSCYNGLYRVNKSGFFNTPIGNKKNLKTFDIDNFSLIRRYFLSSKIEIKSIDFASCVKNAKKNDFVYFDPPYDIYPGQNNFVDYDSKKFDKNEQIRLRDTFLELTKKGVKVMLSNHNTSFINEIYKDFNIHIVKAKRLINSNANKRGLVEEVIITNY